MQYYHYMSQYHHQFLTNSTLVSTQMPPPPPLRCQSIILLPAITMLHQCNHQLLTTTTSRTGSLCEWASAARRLTVTRRSKTGLTPRSVCSASSSSCRSSPFTRVSSSSCSYSSAAFSSTYTREDSSTFRDEFRRGLPHPYVVVLLERTMVKQQQAMKPAVMLMMNKTPPLHHRLLHRRPSPPFGASSERFSAPSYHKHLTELSTKPQQRQQQQQQQHIIIT